MVARLDLVSNQAPDRSGITSLEWPGRESNPHTRRHCVLSAACLPFHHLAVAVLACGGPSSHQTCDVRERGCGTRERRSPSAGFGGGASFASSRRLTLRAHPSAGQEAKQPGAKQEDGVGQRLRHGVCTLLLRPGSRKISNQFCLASRATSRPARRLRGSEARVTSHARGPPADAQSTPRRDRLDEVGSGGGSVVQ